MRGTGPSSTATPQDLMWRITSSIGVAVITQKSAEPGVGLSAFGSNSRPAR